MEKLTIKLANDVTFDVDSINQMYNGADGSSIVTLRIPLVNVEIPAIEENINPDNIKSFEVLADGEKIDEFVGYSVIISIDKSLTKYEQILTVRVRKEKD